MTKPIRIQLSRRRGFRLQALSQAINGLDAVKVDRTTPHGNPWRIVRPGEFRRRWWVQGPRTDEECGSEEGAIALAMRKFRHFAETHPEIWRGLGGKNLACWCGRDAECHADILLKLANKGD